MSLSVAMAPLSPSVARSKAKSTVVSTIDPLLDPRWNRFLQAHPRASLFHSTPWLKTLTDIYDYETVAYTTSFASDELENAIPFCRIKSWLTGRRLVSLPFSDHCAPLVDSEEDKSVLASALKGDLQRDQWDYIEFRPLECFNLSGFPCCTTVDYGYHELDLHPNLDTLFANLHKSSIQRKIHRAEREGLIYREGTSKEFLDQFYRLFLMTRRRHKLPPQSKSWFAALSKNFGEALKVRLAFKGKRAVAGIITIEFKDTMSYKYGASDARFNRLGSVHLLLWRSIQEAKAKGMNCFDFGRTNADQSGLITFKNRWGARQSVMTYSRYGISEGSTHFFDLSTKRWKAETTKYVLSHLPSRMVLKLGQVLYRHAG
jgi:hypothetical protein